MAYDVLIRGGKVIDGSGNPWFYGDVALEGDKVAAVAPRGRIDPANAAEVVDATGHVVCPGFIDIQSHSIMPLFADGRLLSKAHQGVTTEIMGEGWTPAPFGGRIKEPMRSGIIAGGVSEQWAEKAKEWTRFRAWLEAVEANGSSLNIGSFVGGGTIREYARGWDMGEPTAEEVATMCRVMDECMQEGAFGIATALIYPPGSYAGTDELVEIAKVVGRYGGVYITHIRSESDLILDGMGEAIEIGRRGQCSIEIYHLKASGQSSWQLMPKAMEMIDEARASGVDITADMYPYIASGTGITVLIPAWAHEGGKLYENLADEKTRAIIKAEMMDPPLESVGASRASNTDGVMPVGFFKPENRQYIGKNLTEIAEMRGQHWSDAVMDLLLSEQQRISTMYFMMSEENVKRQLQAPWNKVSTDAGGFDPATQDTPTHPRAYGTYPRVLGKYVREEGVLQLEDAIRKMSSAVADRLSLRDRGQLRTGMMADVVIFDPETVIDHSTFTEPHQLSTGIRDVWVNGSRVLQNGTHTGAMPGRIVDGPGR
ncbi:MAG TPA: D-aminoacylase [Thermomicrobiales bacterium]|nr:D-aminoacylase [Thermomicrobiales bacterium]